MHHERVREMYEIREVQGRAYIATQYVAGRSLSHIPSNVLVERPEDGGLKPYVMDFGLARDWHGEHTGAVLGTPHYMAPEQARGEAARLDRRVDIYSLGATLYQVLTGQPLFAGINALEIISRIQSEEPRPPRSLVPSSPCRDKALQRLGVRLPPRHRAAPAGPDLHRRQRGQLPAHRGAQPSSSTWLLSRLCSPPCLLPLHPSYP